MYIHTDVCNNSLLLILVGYNNQDGADLAKTFVDRFNVKADSLPTDRNSLNIVMHKKGAN